MKSTFLSEIPSSVYHLQINEEFTLKNAIAVLPYLHELGIDGIYCSPIFEAASTHGYDVTNPNRLNPAIGSAEDYEEFCAHLQNYQMKQVLDVIPNHMGIKGKQNKWWIDVLEYGPNSAYADFFDIDWDPEKRDLKDKVLLAVLKENYGHALENQEIQLIWERGFWIRYKDYQFPITPASYSFILDCHKTLPSFNEKKLEEQKKSLIQLYEQDPSIRQQFEELLLLFNGKKKVPQSFDLLHALLEKQYYRLAHWLVAGQEINYRRFFNINELISIHIENKKVLEAHHQWVFELIKAKKVQGLRIDHPDGLYDPAEYFARLQEKQPAFVVLEKILDYNEALPEHWRVEGTVGYDFLSLLTGLFIQKKQEKKLSKIYRSFIGYEINFNHLLYERKKVFTSYNMGSEINLLGWRLDQCAEKNRYYRDFTRAALTQALQEVVAAFPVYRTYVREGEEIQKRDKDYIIEAVQRAKHNAPQIESSIFDYLKELFCLELEFGKENNRTIVDLVQRFQQLTAPVMAKGMEDSTFYIYNRLISLNEVGTNPHYFGFYKTEFDRFNKEKLSKWPLGFLTSSTHDTKLSEDVRMRINVLSEIGDRWNKVVKGWQKQNQKYKTAIKHILYPEANTEYYIYQMLLGVWPREGYATPAFLDRIWQCLLKAIREAGLFTSWRMQNDAYERAVKDFFYSILTPAPENGFYHSFLSFQKEISLYGSWNSLSALVLKMGSCGIVDVYQGNELWSYHLMDPDNRRPVDFQKRITAFQDREEIKMFVTKKALTFRRENKELFLKGEYIPLSIQKERQDHAIAFARKLKNQEAIILAGRFFTQLASPEPIGECWGEAFISLPKEIETIEFNELFSGKIIKSQKKGKQHLIKLSEAFSYFPFAILTNLKVL